MAEAAHAVSWDPARQGEAVIDAHSPVHFLVGFTAGILGMDPHLAMLTFIGAKVVDQALRSGPTHALLEREKGQSLGNELADLLLEVGGLHYGELLRKKLVGEQAAAEAVAPETTAGIGRVNFQPFVGVQAVFR